MCSSNADNRSNDDNIKVPHAATKSISRSAKPSKDEAIERHSSRFRNTATARELQFCLSEDESS